MSFFIDNFNFRNNFQITELGDFYTYKDFQNFSILNQYSIYDFDNLNCQMALLNSKNWSNSFNFNIGNIRPLDNLFGTNNIKNNSNIGNISRTELAVSGIDYSIMGKDAAKVKLLRLEMQQKVYAMYKYAKSKGWTMSITSGYRSTQTQKSLYDKWISGNYDVPVVAKPGTSRHEFGCAVDIRVSDNGKSSKEIMAEMGRYGESIGLRWGGNWKKNKEIWHFDIDPKATAIA